MTFTLFTFRHFKMHGVMGDDAEAFNETLIRQAGVINGDSRVLRSYVLRHFWERQP
jgi:hypothetical protein